MTIEKLEIKQDPSIRNKELDQVLNILNAKPIVDKQPKTELKMPKNDSKFYYPNMNPINDDE